MNSAANGAFSEYDSGNVCGGDAQRCLRGHPKLVEDNLEINISFPLPKRGVA